MPLFSCPSTTGWGIGDIGDIPAIAEWIAGAGARVLQLLPLNEMAPGQQSPYSALSAMAIDPIFIRLEHVPDLAAGPGGAPIEPADRAALDRARAAPKIDYRTVRRLKNAALAEAFTRFYDGEWTRDTERAREFKDFVARQAWWIEDYALFRAVHAAENERPWTEWPEPLRRREPAAVDRIRRELARDVLFRQYLQWIADTEWRAARTAAADAGVELFGDLPFMVDGDSADVWARQHQFDLDVSLGAPPDAFSATGQDWGMPVYRWDVVAADDFRWLRARARRSADLYDGFRIDHLVGFYRAYARPRDGRPPFFTPADEREQIALGEQILSIFREPGSQIIAEDLGTVPDFVRASLARVGVPGFRVFRWERFWHEPGQPFREPTEYPAMSVAASGTHDTETLAEWWDHAAEDERQKAAALSSIQRLAAGTDIAHLPYGPTVRDVLIEALFASSSDLLLLPIQDVFGWRERINEPAKVFDDNWSFRLPWPSDQLARVPEVCVRAAALRALSERYSRV
jgi:4-alpha-glucanotransferase